MGIEISKFASENIRNKAYEIDRKGDSNGQIEDNEFFPLIEFAEETCAENEFDEFIKSDTEVALAYSKYNKKNEKVILSNRANTLKNVSNGLTFSAVAASAGGIITSFAMALKQKGGKAGALAVLFGGIAVGLGCLLGSKAANKKSYEIENKAKRL